MYYPQAEHCQNNPYRHNASRSHPHWSHLLLWRPLMSPRMVVTLRLNSLTRPLFFPTPIRIADRATGVWYAVARRKSNARTWPHPNPMGRVRNTPRRICRASRKLRQRSVAGSAAEGAVILPVRIRLHFDRAPRSTAFIPRYVHTPGKGRKHHGSGTSLISNFNSRTGGIGT